MIGARTSRSRKPATNRPPQTASIPAARDHSDVVCVILAGGKGKRMRSGEQHKVCFPIAGVPAINRNLGMLKAVGLRRFVIVVGTMAEQVLSTVATEHPDVAFVYQREPRGTGHAAACALEFLKAAAHSGPIMITMGDKVIQSHVVKELLEKHAQSKAHMTLAALPKSDESSAGRIVLGKDDQPLGIVEVPDIRKASETGAKFTLAGQRFTAAQVEKRSRSVNASLYLFDAPALYQAIAAIRGNNAQGELYLTDTLELIQQDGGRIAALEVANPDDLMAYNTPEELLRIEEVCAARTAHRPRISAAAPRLTPDRFRSAGQWTQLFETNGPELRQLMATIYGSDESLLAERRKAYLALLKECAKVHGPDWQMVLVRAPGRINLMGRHVDHRGGYVNIMAISREVLLAAAPRTDDKVTLRNLDRRQFPDREFHIGELLRSSDWSDWMDFISSVTVKQVLDSSRGDWSNYARAAVLRLQHASPTYRLRGMDAVVSGNIPMGAGLSSSSAMVVAVAEAAVALNGLDVTPQQFVDLCGEGEWFVGSRGGSADHAAIRSGRPGHVSPVGFFPFHVEAPIPWPQDLSLIVANSHQRAAKSEGARDTFNQRVATYRIAEMLLKRSAPLLRSMQHLRDLDPQKLGISTSEVYRLLKRLPEEMSRRQVQKTLAGEKAWLEQLFSNHADIGPYRLRDVTLYGVAECQRSRMFAAKLLSGAIRDVGLLMQISHDGDRVVRWHDGKPRPFRPSHSDAQLDRLIDDSSSAHPARQEAAALWAQPGRYACSTPEMDFIVDTANSCPGVIGAQIAGAGLGGCAMILAHNSGVSNLLSTLKKAYYQPRKLESDMYICRPVSGSSVLTV